jgi:hypothetical protein
LRAPACVIGTTAPSETATPASGLDEHGHAGNDRAVTTPVLAGSTSGEGDSLETVD